MHFTQPKIRKTEIKTFFNNNVLLMRQNIENYTLGKFISEKQSVEHWRSPLACPHSAFTNNHLKCTAGGWLFHLNQTWNTHCPFMSHQVRFKLGERVHPMHRHLESPAEATTLGPFFQRQKAPVLKYAHTNAPFTMERTEALRYLHTPIPGLWEFTTLLWHFPSSSEQRQWIRKARVDRRPLFRKASWN